MEESNQPVAPSNANELQIAESVKAHPAWQRLENQLQWYDNKSVYCQQWYKWIRLAQVSCAVSIPIISHWSPILTSIVGAAIAIMEGVQHINQYPALWTAYRSTAEWLKHEKFLFLSAAGPYRNKTEPERLILLAEFIEEKISTEHAKWVNETNRVITQDTSKNSGA